MVGIWLGKDAIGRVHPIKGEIVERYWGILLFLGSSKTLGAQDVRCSPMGELNLVPSLNM